GATADNWTVKTINPDGQASSAVPFQVVVAAPAPTLSTVTPNPITADPANGYQTLTLSGSNFVNKPTLILTWTGQPGYTLPASQVAFLSSTQLTMSIHLGATADNCTVLPVALPGQASSAVPFQVVVSGVTTEPPGLVWVASPNYNARPAGQVVDS